MAKCRAWPIHSYFLYHVTALSHRMKVIVMPGFPTKYFTTVLRFGV